MKKSFYLWSITIATLLMASCSNEDVPNDDNDVNKESAVSYLSVKLMSSDASSRAASGYEDGTNVENKISKVRFYFFTESGDPANVKLKDTQYVNYYDWVPQDGDQIQGTVDTDVIESKLKEATLVISPQQGDKLPSQMVALINPTEKDPGTTEGETRSLQQLKNLTNDYAKSSLTTEGKFVMFNSVYASGGEEICAVPITSENLAKSEKDAKKNPVTIYVERNVAKVTVTMGENVKAAIEADNKLALKDKEGNDLLVDGQQVYLKINGWRLTAESDRGRLGKRFNPDWITSTTSWMNNVGYYRSCWAMNPSTAENRYGISYADIDSFEAYAYTNENAANYFNSGSGETKEINRTKVILSGRLVDKDGKNFTIVRHLGVHFADDPDNLSNLRESILQQLSAKGYSYYSKVGDTYSQIDKDDIKIVQVTPDLTENSPANDCYMYAQLSTTGEGKNWYKKNDDGTYTSGADINGNLANKNIIDWALVWNKGMTYYFYEIIHRGSGDTATKGVVRNHVYKTTVTDIAGLGTPVYDPDQVIYPEKPNPNDHYIAAQINILSWHIVQNNYQLTW